MDDVASTGMSSWGDYIVECRCSTEMIAYKKNEPTIIHDMDPKSNPLPVESANRLKYYWVVRELVSTTQLSRPHSPESTHSSISSSSSTPSSSSSLPLTNDSHSPSPSSISEDEDRYPNAENIPITPYRINALDALDLATPNNPFQFLRTHARPSGKRKKKQNERNGPNLDQIWDASYNQFINRKKPKLPRCLYGSRRKLDQRGDDRVELVCWFHRLNVGSGREDCRRERGRRMGW